MATSSAISAATSSLVNCSQGHIYSSIYQNCPYCPSVGSNSLSEFSTRIDEPSAPITAIDPPMRDFSTRAGGDETLFEPVDAPAMMHSAATAQSPALAPTEVIAAISAQDPAPAPVVDRSWSTTGAGDRYAPTPPAPYEQPVQAPPQAPPMPDPMPAPMPEREPGPMPPALAMEPMSHLDSLEPERRTIVVADASNPVHSTKGRIVGWLITYSHNPDGEDFRIYAGYNRIGANPVCDIVLGDETVSGSHAIIVYRDGRCLVKDDLSRNGTFVNGKEIGEAYPLQSYDQVRIGNTYLTFIAAQRIT